MKKNKIYFYSLAITTVALSTVVCLPHINKENVSVFDWPEIKKEQSAEVLFVGDAMFDRGIKYASDKNGGFYYVFDNVKKLLQSKDLVVANLEGPITDNKSISYGSIPGSRNNYFFTFDPKITPVLFNENIRLVSLGNNHILNFDKEGLESTKNYLNQTGIDYFGAPNDKISIIKEVKGLKVAFVNYNEFYGDVFGEAENTANEIKRIKPLADIVIAYCHWGEEYQKQPTPAVKQFAHQFIDAGADVVIGSHSHIIGATEEYNGKKIYYSLGNFIFDQYFSEDVRNSMGVEIKINLETKALGFSEKYFYLDTTGQTLTVDKTKNK